jgi:methionine synthase II (cobalamin-independent)
VELVRALHFHRTRTDELEFLPVIRRDLGLDVVIDRKALKRAEIIRHFAKHLGGISFDFSLCESTLN